MIDFGNYSAGLAVADVVREYEIDDCLGFPRPILKLKCLEPSENAAVLDAAFRKPSKGKKAKGGNQAPPSAVSEYRQAMDRERESLAQYGLVGWVEGTVVDKAGNPVPYSDENGLSFLRALPDWVFKKIRDWALNPRNFVPDIMSADEVDDLEGN